MIRHSSNVLIYKGIAILYDHLTSCGVPNLTTHSILPRALRWICTCHRFPEYPLLYPDPSFQKSLPLEEFNPLSRLTREALTSPLRWLEVDALYLSFTPCVYDGYVEFRDPGGFPKIAEEFYERTRARWALAATELYCLIDALPGWARHDTLMLRASEIRSELEKSPIRGAHAPLTNLWNKALWFRRGYRIEAYRQSELTEDDACKKVYAETGGKLSNGPTSIQNWYNKHRKFVDPYEVCVLSVLLYLLEWQSKPHLPPTGLRFCDCPACSACELSYDASFAMPATEYLRQLAPV